MMIVLSKFFGSLIGGFISRQNIKQERSNKVRGFLDVRGWHKTNIKANQLENLMYENHHLKYQLKKGLSHIIKYHFILRILFLIQQPLLIIPIIKFSSDYTNLYN